MAKTEKASDVMVLRREFTWQGEVLPAGTEVDAKSDMYLRCMKPHGTDIAVPKALYDAEINAERMRAQIDKDMAEAADAIMGKPTSVAVAETQETNEAATE